MERSPFLSLILGLFLLLWEDGAARKDNSYPFPLPPKEYASFFPFFLLYKLKNPDVDPRLGPLSPFFFSLFRSPCGVSVIPFRSGGLGDFFSLPLSLSSPPLSGGCHSYPLFVGSFRSSRRNGPPGPETQRTSLFLFPKRAFFKRER